MSAVLSHPFRSMTLVVALLSAAPWALVHPTASATQRGAATDDLRQATQLMRDGKTADALVAVRRQVQITPASVEAANLLDVLGATSEARQVFQRAIDAATEPAAKASLFRAMAMSYGFAGDCANTVRYEEMVIAYWVTREQAEPQNAFYQQGEMANEAARICIDAGELDRAEQLYRRGTELGLKEPGNQTHPRSLWDFRLAHALGRLAARRGNAAEAARQVAAARRLLDGDRTMAAAQERFFPYLVGYVALYTDNLPTAETELTKALQTAGNESDPFLHALAGMTHEKLGQAAKAKAMYERAYGLATAHNPPAAFARRFARAKID